MVYDTGRKGSTSPHTGRGSWRTTETGVRVTRVDPITLSGTQQRDYGETGGIRGRNRK